MSPERPIEISYWVIPRKFLAGEYLGSRDDSAAKAKLKALLDAGMTCFVDLTEADEEHWEHWDALYIYIFGLIAHPDPLHFHPTEEVCGH